MTRLRLILALALLVAGAPLAKGQSADGPRFEVASVLAHTDDGTNNSGFTDNPNQVRIGNMSLRALIRLAYGVLDAQLQGPGWLDNTSFDIVAKPPAGYESRQLPALLRSLLAERFRMVTHRERTEVSGYALRVIKGGRGPAVSTERTFLTARAGLISGKGRSIAELVGILAQNVGAPVVDQTGLTGTFDLQIKWTPLSAQTPTDADVSLFAALREQAGLRLDPLPVPVDVVVVDSIDRVPSPN